MMAAPDPRTIRRALATLERLPNEALADLAEHIIDRLDAAEPDLDLEDDNQDCCPAEDVSISGQHGIGDADDAEPNGDEDEPDDDDLGASEDEPQFPTLRAERDGYVTVHRRRREIIVVTSKGGRPVRVQTVVAERRS